MKHKTLYFLLTGLMVLSMLLAACTQTPVAEETEAPVVETEEPVVETEEPVATEEPAPVFEPLSLSAPDCEYGGLFQTIEAVDEMTVRFTMCAPDPAFLSKIAFSAFAIHSSDYLNESGGGGALLESPIGTGPYVLAEG